MSHFPGEHASLWPGQRPPRETPSPRARRCPPPGLQVRGPDGRDACAGQPALPLRPATRARARPPREIRHRAPAAAAHPVQPGGEPAASPAPRALPCEPERRRTCGSGSSSGSEGSGGWARPGQKRSGGERRGAEGSGSHNGRARGAEPPAPRALEAAAEAQPAQPPNPLPHPRR